MIAVSLDTICWFDNHLGKVHQNDVSQLENVRRKNILALFESRGIRAFGSTVVGSEQTVNWVNETTCIHTVVASRAE